MVPKQGSNILGPTAWPPDKDRGITDGPITLHRETPHNQRPTLYYFNGPHVLHISSHQCSCCLCLWSHPFFLISRMLKKEYFFLPCNYGLIILHLIKNLIKVNHFSLLELEWVRLPFFLNNHFFIAFISCFLSS